MKTKERQTQRKTAIYAFVSDARSNGFRII
jgi:hypothetical protein